MPSRKPATPAAPVDRLLRQVSEAYPQLSPQLQRIARHIEAHHGHIGLEGIQDVARACGVQPSAVVRFAKQVGFSGYTELQKVFRERLSHQIAPGRSYQARIRQVIDESPGPMSAAAIAQAFLGGAQVGLQQLHDGLQAKAAARDLGQAVDLLAAADTLWLVGTRRSFAVAAYLDYALQHTDKRIQLVSALGSMHAGQLRGARRGDVMVAISFAPYADETLAVVRAALDRGVQLVALTDSRMSPLAREAAVALLVQEPATFGFRGLTATLALAQSLFIALAYRLELALQPDPATSPDSPGDTP